MAGNVLASLYGTGASAADLSVSVENDVGKPVRDAVITAYPAVGVPDGPSHFDGPTQVVRQNIQFDPFVMIAPVGVVAVGRNIHDSRVAFDGARVCRQVTVSLRAPASRMTH